jgi:hypothetical protein
MISIGAIVAISQNLAAERSLQLSASSSFYVLYSVCHPQLVVDYHKTLLNLTQILT